MKAKRFVCMALALITLLSLFTACGKEEEPEPTEAQPSEKPVQSVYELSDADVTKEETVFVNLSPDGTVQKINVTDKLHTALPQVRIEDKSDLDNISDVKTFIEPVYENGNMYWNMDSTDLYYTGTSEKSLPLSIKVQYLLDGKEISYTGLAGKSGKVTINISVENELKRTVKADGKKYSIECPMLFMCGMLLPEEGFENLSADKGIVLSDGTHKLVAFVGVPGMNLSLGIDELGLDFLGDTLGGDSYSLSADASDFAIGNLMFVAVPFSSVRALGFKDIGEGVDGFKDILTDLEGLLGSLASLNIEEMLQVLYGDASQLEKLINSVGEAYELYEDNKALLEVLDAFMTEENLNKLEALMNDLDSLEASGIESLSSLAPFTQLLELLGKLDKNIAGLSKLTKDYLQVSPILAELNSELNDPEIKEALSKLPQTLEKLRELIGVMRDSEELIEKTVKIFDSESMKSVKALIDKIKSSESLNALTEAQSLSLTARMKAWLNFGESYDIFTQKTEKQSSSVVFVYKMDAIG